MSKKSFKFEPDRWFKNKDLRSCSAGARGFWVDLLCVCHANGGYLYVNGKPADDNQLARMVGEPVKAVRAWLAELGDAGIFSVDDRGLYSSQMRRVTSKGVAKPKAAPKTRAPAQRQDEEWPVDPRVEAEQAYQFELAEEERNTQAAQAGMPARPVRQTTASAVPKAKALPWYKSPAGWVRKGQEQSVSMLQGEDLDDFKMRVASRLPPGPHLDEMSKYHKDEILRKIEQYAAKEGEDQTKVTPRRPA